uniref:Uncharacterized protein n=1 Tax=Anopheles culicifacies TaxID=139723 RepID=A0A182M1R6_9DIPT
MYDCSHVDKQQSLSSAYHSQNDIQTWRNAETDALHGSCDTVSSNSLWDDPIKIEMIDDTDEKIKIDQLMYLALADVSTSSGEAGSCIPEVGTGFTGRESPSSFLGFKGNTFKNASGLFYDSPKQPDQKPQIRHDCMWAGTCGDLSHPDKHSAVGCGGCNRHLQQLHQSTVSLMFSSAKSLVKTVKAGEPLIGAGEIGRTAGGNRPQPASHPFPTAVKSATFKAVQSSAELPAGSSLLKRQNQLSVMPSQQYKQLPLSPPSSSDSCASSSECVSEGRGHDQRMVLRVPHVSRGSFLAASEQELRSITAQNHARPDTPLSLEDGHPEFKHNNLNILTCTVGSNQQSLLHSSYTSSSTAATGSAGVSSSVNGNITNSATINSTFGGNTSCSSGVTLGGGECRTTAGGYDNRLGGNCSCGGSISSASSIGGVNCHTTQCYYNYLQDDTIPSEEDLRHRIMMIDDPNSLSDLPNHHQHQHNHDVLRSESPSTESVRLRQLLNDLHEIERSSPSRSFLLDDQHASPSACGILAKDGSSQLSIHPHHQQQQAQQQQQGLRNNHSTLAPCGGGMSGGAHIACSKECCWSSLELSHHHLAFPANERKRRHQFDYRRRNITTRGLISDDDEDEEDDLLRQLVEDEDDFDKHLEQFALDYHSNSPLSEDEEDEEEDEEEEEDDEESEEEEEEKKHRMEDDDEEEDENEEEEDEDVQNEKSMYGSSSGRSRSRNRTSRHRYHNQYHQHRRTAARASYRSYEGDAAYGNGKASKMPATNLLGNGTVNTIIAGSGASSLKPSLLGSKAGNGSSLSSAGTATSTGLTQQSAGTNNNSYQATHFGDHSYTRPKGGYNMNELGVQTPSDSGSEKCVRNENILKHREHKRL